ncbi:MAG: 7-carboxy-7-deazaguanine synthase QueE [Bacteroidia bacterium]|jgi:organic radical activating enzyme|tara:strand:- start:10733 stop:11332 length:600 start_codon:yes stop_codon:yes gene_type:complete
MIDFPVMEYFYSIQGEGVYTGQPAFFIRLGGCDVGCVWCDVKDSWDADKHPKKSIEFLVDEAKKHPSRILILTGGEPAMYDLTLITQAFKKEGFRVHIETSGAYELVGYFDWVTFSPKKFKAPIAIAAIQADELKVVVLNKSDIAWAEEHQKMVPDTCKLYLQPEWDKREITEKIIFDYVLKNPNWFVSLQTHKYLGVD